MLALVSTFFIPPWGKYGADLFRVGSRPIKI
nr:MAG TPA: hypothetical protein [Caudoviricetes sp.]